MVDEMARSMGNDPVAFRLEFLKTDAERAVLDKVASAGSGDGRWPAGTAQGVAHPRGVQSVVAYLVEIDCTDLDTAGDQGRSCAVDVGAAGQPEGLEAQVRAA